MAWPKPCHFYLLQLLKNSLAKEVLLADAESVDDYQSAI